MSRNFSSTAVAAALGAPATAIDTVWQVSDVTGWPPPPFSLIVDKDRATEEVVTCTAVTGLTINVTRGEDGTAALPHAVGASVVHGASARDFREPLDHVASAGVVHGILGHVVGDTDAQTLSNKTFQDQTGSSPAAVFKQGTATSGRVLDVRTNTNVSVGGFDVDGRIATTGVDGTGLSIFTAGSPSSTALRVKGKASQTANLVEVQDSGGTIIFSVDAAGNVYAPNLTQDTLNATNVVAQSVTTVALATSGNAIIGGSATVSGNVAAGGNVSGVNGVFSGSLTVATVTTTGVASVASLTASGGVSGGTLTAGSGISHQGGAPVPVMAAGSASLSVSAASFGSTTISFPGGRFQVAPLVTATISNSVTNSGKLVARVTNVTTTGATVQLYVGDGSAVTASGVTVSWHAVQMTIGSAAG